MRSPPRPSAHHSCRRNVRYADGPRRGALRGGVERDGHRDIGGDELKDGRQAAVVREGFVMEALCQAGDPDEGTHDGEEMRHQWFLPQLTRRTHTPFKRRKRYAWPI